MSQQTFLIDLNQSIERYFSKTNIVRARQILHWISKHPSHVFFKVETRTSFHLEGDKEDFAILPSVDFIEYFCYIFNPDDNKEINADFEQITSRLIESGAPKHFFTSA